MPGPFTLEVYARYGVKRLNKVKVLSRIHFNEPLNRWFDRDTGRIVSEGFARRKIGTIHYWNKVKALTRTGNYKSMGEAREAYEMFKASITDVPKEVWQAEAQALFSP